MKKTTIYAVCLVVSSLFFSQRVSFAAQDATIVGLSVSGSEPLKVSFTVQDAFTKEMEDALKSGFPIAFTFNVELDRIRGMWIDEGLGAWEFRRVARYDTLKDEYVVSQGGVNGNGESGVRTKDFNEMKEIMSALTLAHIAPAKALIAGESYELRAKATLKTVTLPFFLDHVLFFVKAWNIETDWFSYRFSR